MFFLAGDDRTLHSMTPNRSSHSLLSCADGIAMSTADFVLLAGRILLGLIYLRSGFPKLFDIAHVAATYPPRGLATWLVWIAVPAEFFGGLFVILGLATRYVAIVLIVFTVVASFASHAYWDVADAAARRAQDTNFWKNMSMIGGFLIYFVAGPGRFSVDRWLAQREAKAHLSVRPRVSGDPALFPLCFWIPACAGMNGREFMRRP
jgi:putative oxidoreductase